jgi:hypothetical protein
MGTGQTEIFPQGVAVEDGGGCRLDIVFGHEKVSFDDVYLYVVRVVTNRFFDIFFALNFCSLLETKNDYDYDVSDGDYDDDDGVHDVHMMVVVIMVDNIN